MTEWLWKSALRWLVIAAPILVAKVSGLFDGYFSRPSYIAVGLTAALVAILAATLVEKLWGRKRT